MNHWHNLKTIFNEKLPRRTSVLIKENTESSAYYFPLDFGKIGYQVDTREESTYEEQSDFWFNIEEYALGDLLNESNWVKQSFRFNDMISAPNWIQRSASFMNTGLDLLETLTSPKDNGITWELQFKQRCLHHKLDRTFMLTMTTNTEMEVHQSHNEKNLVLNLINSNGKQLSICLPMNQTFGVYSSIKQARDAHPQLNGRKQVLKGRYLVLPIHISFPAVTSSKHFHESTFLLSMSTLGPKEAVENYVYDAELLTEDRWNAFYASLPSIRANNEDTIQKAYDKCWYVIRQNYFTHSQWGKIILEALPVYKGVWTWGTSALPYSALLNPDHGTERARNALNLLLTNIRDDGYIPHAIYINESLPGQKWNRGIGIIQTPHLPWVILEYYEKTKDEELLKQWYTPLLEFYNYISRTRDEKYENLHLWAAETSFDTGIDVYPVFSDITYNNKEDYVYPSVFAAERYRYEASMSAISEIIGQYEDAAYWKEEMQKTIDSANTYLWDEEKAWYGVRHCNGDLETIIGVDGLFFLAYGLVSDQKANDMKCNFKQLIGQYGVHTVSPSEDQYEADIYWRGPAWAKSCALGVQAAQLYFPDTIPQLKDSILSFIMKWPSIWECMNAETGEIARGDIGVYATPFIASNVGAGELLSALFTLSNYEDSSQ
ncbi:hypothetical protein [Pontibacillus sp. HMF3514]|uniref:MGH1-like glycoside hydrolase domain-containing protein n=1 Tax=Pontibacillus sp. HMF3514 TaxID=2692425 RepID=UPI00131F5F24|nr:hypothetical protein [Pontibacillus sp. HMF3514]QHE53016.1 hypothetical protein GS400_13740 [Pontibacillus sp. HMF3514]